MVMKLQRRVDELIKMWKLQGYTEEEIYEAILQLEGRMKMRQQLNKVLGKNAVATLKNGGEFYFTVTRITDEKIYGYDIHHHPINFNMEEIDSIQEWTSRATAYNTSK